MGGIPESTFECEVCGATAFTTAIEYDPLGYAVCPDCGHTGGPAADPVRIGAD